ncbi:MAG TPA: hypothetical protein VGR87_13485 [Candidatus Limnocylindria bacterium]|jgi:hypothetical protein|nr:hypothetical protein [Candidatus Limnocylindria bacterium]
MSRRMSWSAPLLVGATFGALSTLATVGDSDLYWHLAQGRQTLAEGLARLDRFSWTVNGAPVLTDQWLGQVAWYGAYAAWGWHGIVLLRAVLVMAIVALVVAAALSVHARPFVAVLAALPAIALTRFSWTERPELMGLACFAALLLIVRLAEERPRVLLGAPFLLLLWANLHGSFALGLVVVAIVCGELALRRGDARALALGVVFASVVATLVTPSGPAIWTSAGGHFLAPPRVIQEEGVPDVTEPYGLVFAFVIAAVLVTSLLSRPAPLREAALLIPLFFVSLTAARHTPFFAVASAPYLAAHAPDAIAAIARRLRVPLPSLGLPTAVPGMRIDLATGILGIVAVIAAAALARAEPDLRSYPVAALESLPKGTGLLNEYDWGGFLIWYAPATPVFVDGRLFPYLPGVLDDYRAIVGLRPEWQSVIARRDVRALLLRPAAPVAVRARELGWRVVSSSTGYVLLARP